MKIRPLIINGTEIPLREPTPLQVMAHLQAGSSFPVDSTYLLLCWVGDLGGASPRKRGEPMEEYAERVLAELMAKGAGMMEVIKAVDPCWGDAVRQSGVLPSKEAVDAAGESSAAREAKPSSSP